ncbi:MAG TPA: PHB depolymerase family esterase [Casimicrobiaceae bacterium]|nr:PHB depolymerase family esterase [Casimicrobiaceae bacterium]
MSWLGTLGSVFLGGLAAGSLHAAVASPQDTIVTVTVGAQQRSAYLHVPAGFDRARKYPLLIGFHGGAGNAREYIEQAQLFAKGEQAGFIVVCPEGTPLHGMGEHRVWNSGPEYAASVGNADDVAFTRQLIDKVSSLYPVDPKRIYATGFSNGAQMTYRLALELSDRVAAIAAMSGGRLAQGRQPGRAVPVLHIHGTADGFYPFAGGLGPYSIGLTPHVAIDAVIREWCRFNGAALTPQTRTFDAYEMQLHDGPAPVILIRVDGLGHQIAGGNDDHLPHQALLPRPDAVAVALEFFARHPMP